MAEATYYFNARHATEAWETTPDNMVDGVETNYAATTGDNVVQLLTANNCPGTDLGTITKVELRFYGYNDTDDQTILRPVFAGGDGNDHVVVPGTTPGWKAYQDITNDPNKPSPWTFAAVVALDCDVESNNVSKGNTKRVGEVEIRVTYELLPEAPTNLASPSQTETTIDLTWTLGANTDKTLIRFKEGGYPTSKTDGNKAYFDTGASVTVGGAQSIIQDDVSSTTAMYAGSNIRLGERVNGFPVINISRVSFNLNKSGSPTGTAYIRIRKVSDDSILATIGTKDVETITTTKTWYDFDCNIDNPTEQDLRFTVEYDGGNATNFIRVCHNDSDVLADAVWSSYVASWFDSSAQDSAIKIYYSIPLTPATTYYFRAWGYQSATGLYSDETVDLTQATTGAPPAGQPYSSRVQGVQGMRTWGGI